jgi:hypothetical protein
MTKLLISQQCFAVNGAKDANGQTARVENGVIGTSEIIR